MQMVPGMLLVSEHVQECFTCLNTCIFFVNGMNYFFLPCKNDLIVSKAFKVLYYSF